MPTLCYIGVSSCNITQHNTTQHKQTYHAINRDASASRNAGMYSSKKMAVATNESAIKWQRMVPKAKKWTEKLSVTPMQPHTSRESQLLASKLVPLRAPQQSLRLPMVATLLWCGSEKRRRFCRGAADPSRVGIANGNARFVVSGGKRKRFFGRPNVDSPCLQKVCEKIP